MSNAAPPPPHEAELITPPEIAAVREHLEEILNSRTLAGSRRTQEFLRLIVNHALDGETESLRERMIGAELFGRPVSYDTGNDSVVRVRASEVRRKLAQYYGGEAKNQEAAVRIELPSGSYVPRFHFAPPPVQPSDSAVTSPASPTEGQQARTPVEHHIAPEERTASARRPGRTVWLGLGIVAACILLALVAVVLLQRSRIGSASTPAAGIHSIVVLPFDNLSGDASQDYFADGLTEELINDLGQVSTLRIISFTSSMSLKKTQKKLPEIARELAVDGVVEGGVLRDGNQVRISVQLIDAQSDRPVWASSYVQDLTSVFAWQGEVAQSIAEEIRTKVTPEEQQRLARRQPVDPEAQDLYLHGLLLRNVSNCKKGIDYFDQAIQRSPDYAQAYSGLASCYGMLGESGQLPYEEAFSRQKADALRAISLDDSLSEAHAELGNTAMTLDRNWTVAAAEFREALELNPSSATNHEKYAFYLVRTGHSPEALAEIERSVELDPVSGSTFHTEGFINYFARRYDQALAVTRTVQGLNVGLPDWNFLLGDIDAEKGNYHDAVAAFLESGDGPYSLGHLGNVYARMGRTADAKRIIDRLAGSVRQDGVGQYEIALIYAGLGDRNEAFQWLEEAYRAHDVGLVYLKVDPCLDPLRSDPRLDLLMHRIGLGAQ